MEEVRRMKIVLRVKGGEKGQEEELRNQLYSSAIPILQEVPFLKEKNVRNYYTTYFGISLGILLFGGIIAPTLEVKMGMGGQSYMEFIRMMHLPEQLALVDPIVASFCGGAIGVLSAFFVVDANYIKAQRRNRCYYCQGAGYLTCGSCVGEGCVEDGCRCSLCSGSGKVMCTNCLSTGKHLVTEHDPRIDPFDWARPHKEISDLFSFLLLPVKFHGLEGVCTLERLKLKSRHEVQEALIGILIETSGTFLFTLCILNLVHKQAT